MIVMKPEATPRRRSRRSIDRIESRRRHAPTPAAGEEVTVIGAIGDREHEVRVSALELEGQPGVRQVVPILKPYKLASSQFAARRAHRCSRSAARKIGGEHFALIAGPCTVESREQLLTDRATSCSDAGATHAPRRRLQAAHLAVLLPGPRARRACASSPRPRKRPACRSSPS